MCRNCDVTDEILEAAAVGYRAAGRPLVAAMFSPPDDTDELKEMLEQSTPKERQEVLLVFATLQKHTMTISGTFIEIMKALGDELDMQVIVHSDPDNTHAPSRN